MSDNKNNKANIGRRKFLKGAGITAAGAVGASAASIQLSKTPYDQKYPVFPRNKVELPSNGKTVVIMGGGLAGLQAGVELSARGFKVTVLEKTGTPGGKLKTWRDKTFGPADDPAKKDPDFKGYVREHGIHAIWGFYNNLREFMHRYGWELQDTAQDESMYLFMDKDGKKADWKISSLPQPFGSLMQAFYTADMGDYIKEEDRSDFFKSMRKLGSFDITDKKQRDYMDSISFEDYANQIGMPKSIIDGIMDSMIEMAFFDNAKKASALSIANLIQLGRGAPNDMNINLYMNPPGETFLQPMVEYIESHGGEVIYNTELTDLDIEREKVKALIANQVGNGKQPIARCSVCGALLGPDGKEFTKCPVCGANGDMIKNLNNGELQTRRYTADYYVSAMDIPASQQFYSRNKEQVGSDDYFNNIQKLSAVHVYVVNLWYEGQEAWKDSVRISKDKYALDFFATGFQDLGITINWSLPFLGDNRTEPLIKDYKGKNVSIIETQIADAQSISHLSDEEIVERVHQELKMVIPELPEYQSSYVNRWRHYSGCRVGDNQNRPSIQSPIDNLLFIGDMPFIEHPAVFMEKTNVTSRMATNILLDKIGQKEGKITVLPSGTPGIVDNIVKKSGSVFPVQ